MTITTIIATIITALLCLAPARAHYCDLDPEVRVRIGLPDGDCVPLSVKPPTEETAALVWCCGFESGGCVQVTYASDCDPAVEFAVSCDWGVCEDDGTITCYE